MKMTQSEFLEYAKQFNNVQYSEEKADKIVNILINEFGFRIENVKQAKFRIISEEHNNKSLHKEFVPNYEGILIKVDYEAGKAIKVCVAQLMGKGEFYYDIEDYDTTNKFKTNKEAKEAIEKIRKLARSYDHYTQYIDNYNQMKATERNNEEIERKIDDLLSKF